MLRPFYLRHCPLRLSHLNKNFCCWDLHRLWFLPSVLSYMYNYTSSTTARTKDIMTDKSSSMFLFHYQLALGELNHMP